MFVAIAREKILLCSHKPWAPSFTSRSHRLRQFPLYSKTAPPSALVPYFKPETFKKSQEYGRDKAKFSLVSGFFKQAVDSTFVQFGLMAWSWKAGGWIIGKLGYGSEYEVSFWFFLR